MNTENLHKVIYQLTVEDLQTVADEVLGRRLSEKEIGLLERKIGNHINWYDAIESAINLTLK